MLRNYQYDTLIRAPLVGGLAVFEFSQENDSFINPAVEFRSRVLI